MAEVDPCQNSIRNILLQEEKAVAYRQALSRNDSPELPEKILRKGQRVLSSLKQKAANYDPVAYAGIATSVFREASNGKQAVAQLRETAGVPLRLISQDMEARLGLIGARPHANSTGNAVAVWDIGAGSMQLVVDRDEKKPDIFRGTLASLPFKRTVLAMKGRNPDRVNSPNPLGISLALFAMAYAHQYARQKVPSSIRSRLRNMNDPVIGIGGVHVYSIRPQIPGKKTEPYPRSGVQQTLMRRAPLSDDEIGGDYASTEVTNLALVSGMMEALEIDRVRVADVNLTDGLLLADQFWTEPSKQKD